MTTKLERQKLEYAKQANTNFRSCFTSNGAAFVLRDLAKFCFAADTTQISNDYHDTMINEGRRQVWLHIMGYFALTQEEVTTLVLGGRYARKDEDG